MFCGKCGAKNVEYAEFCAACGAKLNKNQYVNSVPSAVTEANNSNRKVGIAIVVLVAVVVFGVIFFAFGGRNYKTTVKKFVNATFEGDANAIIKLVPGEVIDYMLEEEDYDSDDLDTFIDEGNDELQNMLDSLDGYLGKGWEASCEIKDVNDMKKSDLSDLKERYEDIDIKVSEAKTIEVECTIKADENETSNSMDIMVIKVGRSWYLDVISMGELF